MRRTIKIIHGKIQTSCVIALVTHLTSASCRSGRVSSTYKQQSISFQPREQYISECQPCISRFLKRRTRKNKSESDNIAVIEAMTTSGITSDISIVPKSPNGPPVVTTPKPLPFFRESSRQMKSQQEFPTRNDLQSCKRINRINVNCHHQK